MNKKLIHSVVADVAARFPDRIAVQDADRQTTYRALNNSANRLACALQELGVQRHVKVGVLMPSGTELVVSLLAVFKAGGIYLPVDLEFPVRKFERVLQQCLPPVLLTAAASFETARRRLAEAAVPYQCLVGLAEDGTFQLCRAGRQPGPWGQQWPAGDAYANPPLVNHPDDGNYIFYTSGSTGEPKAILGCHKSLGHFIDWQAQEFGVDQSCRVSQLTQFTFDASLRDVFLPLCTGGTLVIPAAGVRTNAWKLIEWLEEQAVTHVHYVPSLFRLLTRELGQSDKQRPVFPAMRHFLLAGEMLYARDVQQWRQAVGGHVELVNLYGPTETTLVKTCYRVGDVAGDPARVLPVGKPIGHTLVAVINDGLACRVGEIGEVYIKTPFVTKGYPFDPAQHARVFVQNPLVQDQEDIVYKTGDLGQLLPSGDLEILGRTDSQLKINGVRVELAEVEKALLRLDGVRESVIVPHTDDQQHVTCIAYYTGDAQPAGTLRAALAEELHPAAIPGHFIHLESFPLTFNGKVDRKALPRPEALLIGETRYEAAAGETELRLEAIWKEVLSLGRIGRKAPFFAIGGTSLKAIRVISRIYKESGVLLKVGDLFNHPTVEELARLVDGVRGTPAGAAPAEPRAGDEAPDGRAPKAYEEINTLPLQPHYELSHAQKRLWVLSRFDQAASAYTIHSAYRLRGTLDPALFQRVFDALVERHEVLRTTFLTIDGEPRQRIYTPQEAGFAVAFRDLREEARREEIALAIVREQAQLPFDLENGRLLRAALLQTGHREYYFSFAVHHIISDAWTVELLVTEVLRLYQAYAAGGENPLPALRIQYKEYAAWQNAQLAGEHRLNHQRYWLEQLGGQLPVLQLPADYPRPAVRTFRGDWVTIQLGREVMQDLDQLAQARQASLFMTMLAAVKALLHRYTGQEDIIIGTPVAGRDHPDLEDQAGFYINNLAVRTRLSAADSFNHLLDRVKAQLLQALEHQIYPFDRLVEELRLVRDTSRSPLFDVVVVMPGVGIESADQTQWPALHCQPLEAGAHSSTVDLRIVLVEQAAGLSVTFEYNTDLFSEASVRRMAGHFEQLIHSILEHPARPIGQLAYLPAWEKAAVVRDFNATAQPTDYERCIPALFEDQAARHPGATALVTAGGDVYTYRQVNEEANRLAAYLRNECGLRPNELVGLMADRSERLIIALLAVWKAGAAYVPLMPDWPAQRKAYVLADAGVRLLLIESDRLLEVTEYYSGPLFTLDMQWPVLENHPGDLPAVNQPADLAYVIYTSGSTGQPKGVMIEHRSNVNMALGVVRQFGITPGDRVLQFAAITFDASVYEITTALYAGAALVLMEPSITRDALRFTEFMAARNVTVATLPPSFLSTLPLDQLAGLNVLVTAGEAANPADLAYGSRFARCFNAYGPTECAVCVTAYPVSAADADRNPLPIGRPIANTQVYVLDAGLQPVAIGVEGELYVGGPALARGYLGQAALSAGPFIENPFEPGTRLYRTGDTGKWLPDGNLVFTGRRDSQVKLHGYRIEPGEIEQVLARHERVQDAVVMLREAPDHCLVAYYAGEAVPAADLKAYLGQYLPAYMIPAYFVPLPALPLTAHGKIDHAQLPGPVGDEQRRTAYVAPRNAVQEKIADIWERVLGRRPIGIHDHFFELGGHSLKATQVLALVQQAFHTRLDLGAFFLTPTIAALADLVERAGPADDSHIAPLPGQAYYAVSDAQRRMWVLNQFEEAAAAYQLAAAFVVEGPVDQAAFSRAFAALLARHETLRTTFAEVNGELKQRIHAPESLAAHVTYTDLRRQPGGSPEYLAGQTLAQPFALDGGLLIRLHLYQLADQQYFFVFAMHHIIGDEWSMGVLVSELLHCYEAYRQGAAPQLPPLRIQYKEFAAWQQARLAGPAFEEHRQFWLRRFAVPAEAMALPAPRPHPEMQTFRGSAVDRTLPADLSRALLAFGQNRGASLFMTLSTTLYALLYRYTGQHDLTIGTPVALRQHADLQHQVGLYLNTLALRTTVAAQDDFTSLLGRVKQQTTEAYAHQEYPFDRLVDDLALPRDLSRHPLFDVMLVLHNREDEERASPRLAGLSIAPYPLAVAATKFDLSFNFRETEAGLHINAEYNRDLFTPGWVDRLLQHYQTLVQLLLELPQTPIGHLGYLSEAEREHVRHGVNATRAAFPADQTLVSLIEAQVARTPDAIAVQYEDIALTYRELNQLGNQLAHYLRRQYAVGPDAVVAVLMERSERMLIALLGILKAGAAYLPIDPAHPGERIAYLLDDAQARCLLTDEAERITFPLTSCGLVTSQDWQAIRQMPATDPAPLAAPQHLAYVMYTSGSTGQPKGVLIEHQGAVNRLDWMWKHYAFTAQDVILQKTPYGFDVSVWELWMPLCFGARLVLCRPEAVYDMGQLVRQIAAYGVTTLHFVPSMLQVFLQAVDEDNRPQLASLRRVFASGEALLPGMVRQHYQRTGVPLHNLYGPTEASVDVTYYATKPGDPLIPIGRPIANTQLYVLDAEGQLVPEGIWGELVIGGVGLARGYLNRPELTAARFRTLTFGDGKSQRVYHTGDVGRWLPGGDLEYKGRNDLQVKLRGQRIELGEIENRLLQHPAVESAAVAVRGAGGGQASLVGYVVSPQQPAAHELRSYLGRYLPAYMLPDYYVFLPQLPLTTNGKLNRKALPDPVTEAGGSERAYAAPANAVEMQLSLILQEVLGKSRVSVHDNFFDSGGNSLRLILAYQKMKPLFPGLKVTDLFKYSSIRSLSAFLATEQETADVEGIEV